MTTTDTGIPLTEQKLQPGSSRTPVRDFDTCLPSGALQRAVLLVGAVHDEGPREVEMLLRRLTRTDLYSLAVVLAALVPADYTPAELLAWNDHQYARPRPTPAAGSQPPLFPAVATGGRPLKPHGTHAAFNRHKAAGEDPCEPCVFGERDFQRDRQRTRRSTAAARAEAAS
jgi:hypothetical protein